MSLVIVVAGGEPPDPALRALLPPAGAVIAADSGLDHARALGLHPTVLVGDLDSITAEGLHWAQEHELTIERHPADKDQTDLELALTIACRSGDEVLVVDGRVGRFDHAVGNLLLLGSERWAGVKMSGLIGGSLLSVVRGTGEITGNVGDVVSLFPIGGPASAVTTTGLRWGLQAATLQPGSSLGTSNEFIAQKATIQVGAGIVYAIQPK